MSYILNALKKAEQDRLRDDPKDLEDFASARWDPYEQKPSSNKAVMGLVCVSLVIISLATVTYLGGFKPLVQKTEVVLDSQQAEEVIVQSPTVTKLVVEENLFALPVLEISGHMYFSQGSKSNRLFANDQSFKEGEMVANGWRLKAVGIDGIEMVKQQRSVFLAYP